MSLHKRAYNSRSASAGSWTSVFAVLGVLALCAIAHAQPQPVAEWSYTGEPSLSIRDGYQILHLKGSPEDLGRQHGELAGDLVRRVLDDVITNGEAADDRAERLYAGARVMEEYLPDAFRRELKALADAAGVDYISLVALQLFGDINRGQLCSSFAAFGPATHNGELVAGRNMDYYDNGASRYGAVIICYYPDEGIPFITVSWAGIINGWTAMNASGVIVSNNTAYGGTDSLEGLSTCFLLRKVAQYAHSVDEGIEIIRSTPRACGTVMMVAGGNPPDAAMVEYDHEAVEVRRATNGWIAGTNDFRKLYRDHEDGWFWECSRYAALEELIHDNYGHIDRDMKFIADPRVAMGDINLHSAMLFPADLTVRISMGEVPAFEHRYREFRFTPEGLLPASQALAFSHSPI